MTIEEYIEAARAFVNENADMSYYGLGVAAEGGEVAQAVQKDIWVRPSRDKIREEAGDLMWYLMMLLRWYDLELSEVLQANIDKLRARYPNGYDRHAHGNH